MSCRGNWGMEKCCQHIWAKFDNIFWGKEKKAECPVVPIGTLMAAAPDRLSTLQTLLVINLPQMSNQLKKDPCLHQLALKLTISFKKAGGNHELGDSQHSSSIGVGRNAFGPCSVFLEPISEHWTWMT